MIKIYTLIVLLFGLGLPLAAQDKADLQAIQRIRKEGLEHSRVMDIAFQITDVAGPTEKGTGLGDEAVQRMGFEKRTPRIMGEIW
jgi:hypothetical protein